MSEPLRIVLGNGSLAKYPEGGGHWSCFLQHFLAFHALGHDVWWLEILPRSGNRTVDDKRCRIFFERMAVHGLAERSCLVLCDKDEPIVPERADWRGITAQRAVELITSADLLWNYTCSIRQPLLGRFRRRALIDLDPGELQVAALTWDLGFADHQVHFTVGLNVGQPDAEVPLLGCTWHPFVPVIHLPLWQVTPTPPGAPITSITQWTWLELRLGERRLSLAKREPYLRLANLPRHHTRRFELAANLHPDDRTGDRETMLAGGWHLVHPHDCVATPEAYHDYIRRSWAELCCPKPIHCELRTGWFSDRSAAYLASGRPVLMESTGFERWLGAGNGLLSFTSIESLDAAIADLETRYTDHCRAARQFAEEHLDAARVIPQMLAVCG